MKNTIIKMGAMLALVSSAAAFAAPPTADLEVRGSIKTPGCMVTPGDNNGEYSYGSISPIVINPGTAHFALGPQTQTWTVSCDAKTYLTFEVVDNQHSSTSVNDQTSFGLGTINGDGKIGYYKVTTDNPKVDGVESWIFLGNRGDSTGNGYAKQSITLGKVHGWTDNYSLQSPLRAGQEFVVDLMVQPYLAGATTMKGPVSENVPLSGSLTINYSFGL